MDEILNSKHRDDLIERFANVAKADLLTNMDALAIVNILVEACRRASVNLEEEMLRGLIEGEDPSSGLEDAE